MKPFNLKEAQQGAPPVTLGGDKALVKIGDLEFPRPVREPLDEWQEYFAVSLLSREPIQPFNWFGMTMICACCNGD